MFEARCRIFINFAFKVEYEKLDVKMNKKTLLSSPEFCSILEKYFLD